MLLSVVIPARDEAETLPLLFERLRRTVARIGCEYEIVVIDDGSRDGTAEFLEREANTDSRVKLLQFSRNFGHQIAVTAGLDFARGDAVVVMDADLQDPPELVAEMVERYREGYEVVSAQRVSRRAESAFKRGSAAIFYRFMRRFVDERLTEDVGDFRLLSRGAVMALRQFREGHRFMRGLVAWLGLRETMVPFERDARPAGDTKYHFLRMVRLAWTAITSFSAAPVRAIGVFGGLLSLAGFLYLGYALYAALVLHAVVQGWTTLVALQCIFSGAILISLGVIGDYLGRLYEEMKQRPLYVLQRTLNVAVPHPPQGRSVVVPPRPDAKGVEGR
jgi:dolichol-phosphate mannosyltransferase